MKQTTIKRNNYNRLLWWLLAIMAVPTFLPLLHSGLTNSDAIIFHYAARTHPGLSSLFNFGHQYFLHTGRLTHLLTGWIMYLPFAAHSNALFLLLVILPILLDFLLAILLVRKYSRNETVAQLAALLMLCGFAIHTGFSGSIGFPFWFSSSFLLLLISLFFLLRYKNNRKFRELLLSALFILLSTIFYEAYLAYYLVIYLILRSQYDSRLYREKESRRKFVKELLPFVIGGLLYILAYIIVSKSVPTHYTGVKWSFSLLNTLRSWGNIILYSIPGMSFYQYRILLAGITGDPQFHYSFFYMLVHAGTTAWAKGLLAVALFYGILSAADLKTTGRRLWIALLIAVMMATLPHLLLCCSSKYVQDIPDSYVTSYFANFGMVLTFTVLCLLGRHYLSKRPVIQKIFSALFACGLLLVTILTQFTNEQVMQDVKRANLRHTQAEKFLQKEKIVLDGDKPVWNGRFQVTPTQTGKMICAELHGGIDFYLGLEGIYEYDYPIFYERYRNSKDYVIIFTCQQAAKSDDLYYTFFQCRGTDLTEDYRQIACDTVIVGYYSAYKSFALSILSEADSGTVQLNGMPLHSIANAHYGNIQFLNKPAMQTFTLTGKGLLPATMSISNILYPGVEPVSFRHLPPRYRRDGIRYFEHDIWKHQLRKAELDSLAVQQGRDPKEFLRGNAEWLLIFQDQY